MISFDDVTPNLRWAQTPDCSYKVLIIGCSRLVKTNTLLNLIIQQPNLDQLRLFTKDPYEIKH